jgi:hypothetical protein
MAYWLLAVLAVATLLGFVATFLSFLWFLKQLVVIKLALRTQRRVPAKYTGGASEFPRLSQFPEASAPARAEASP